MHCDKIELFCVIFVREKYGAAEFRFFWSWIGKFISDVDGYSDGSGRTNLKLCKFKSFEIFQVRIHDLFWLINNDTWDLSNFFCILNYIDLSKNEQYRSWIKVLNFSYAVSFFYHCFWLILWSMSANLSQMTNFRWIFR